MPRKPKSDGDGTVHKAARPGRNGFDPDDVLRRVESAEAEMLAIDEIMRKATEACQPHVDEIKAIKKAAAEDGNIPKKVFSAKLRERGLKRKADAVRGTLSEEQQETFDQVSHALGDLAELPLGAAVLEQHPDAAAAPH